MDKELKTIRMHLVMAQSERDAIDSWRKEQSDLPSRSEAIRRLVMLGIEQSSENKAAKELAEQYDEQSNVER